MFQFLANLVMESLDNVNMTCEEKSLQQHKYKNTTEMHNKQPIHNNR